MDGASRIGLERASQGRIRRRTLRRQDLLAEGILEQATVVLVLHLAEHEPQEHLAGKLGRRPRN